MNETLATQTEQETAGAGHNLPPTDADQQAENIRAGLKERHGWLWDRQAELLAAVPKVPDITDDATAGKAGDFVKQISAAIKALNGARTAEKEPFLSAGRIVDGLFRSAIDPLTKAKEAISTKRDVYLKAKEEAERKRREEEAERLRIENERLRREAAEAEQRRQAEEEERKAEARRQEDARLAEIQRKEDERKADIQRDKNERLSKVARRLLDGKIDEERAAELRQQINERTEKVSAESDELLERAFERAERASEKEVERLAIEKRRADRETKREEKTLERAKGAATKAEKAAEAPAADLARTRGEYGSVGTLQQHWDFRVVSWPEVDLEALRPFLAQDAVEAAIRAFIKVGHRELAGVEIFEDLVGQTR